MTERILSPQLLKLVQAAGPGYSQANPEWVKKFAELIVRECMEQVWYTREDGINGNISEVIKERMKQHFGVEE